MSHDRIEVRGLRVLGRHGVLPEERERPQPFEIDLDLEADLAAAAGSDNLAATVDYGHVVRQVARLASSESYQLLEALAEAIARMLLEDPKVTAVRVRVAKLRPPIPADVTSVAVVLHRGRARS